MTTLTMDDFKIWKFPNGEWGVKINPALHPDNDPLALNFKWPDPLNPDFMLPILIGHAIQGVYGRDLILNIPYLPYLRQDRVFDFGGVAANRVIAKIFSSAFNYVFTLQPHTNCPNIRGARFKPALFDIMQGTSFQTVRPDMNSPTSVYDIYPIKFNKVRKNGLLEFSLIEGVRESEVAVIFDDLCDGGGTFIECASILKGMGFTKVILCVAHGIFSKGIDHLFNNGIDKIITTDSVCRLEPSEKLIILDAFKEMEA